MKKFVLVALALSSAVSVAQTVKQAPVREAKAKVTKVDFAEGDLIDGETLAPNGVVITEPVRPKYGSLIKVRDNFNDKLAASVSEM